MNNSGKNKNGFTIIETMISISLFLIVIMSGMNALLNANVIHQKSQDMRSILDNLSFILEDMSKNLRTGYDYHCFVAGDTIPTSPTSLISQPKSCTSGGAVAFESAIGDSTDEDGDPVDDNDQWVYYLTTVNGKGTIWKSTQGPYNYPTNFVQLNPDEVDLNLSTSGFSVLGAEHPTGNSQQPLVTIRLSGTITYKNNIITPFSMQTSVSQRLIDVLP